MNFLAHFYLSYPNELLTVGNFMGDFVKGKKYLDYSPEIAKGILLHRSIDYFTDTNPITGRIKDIFYPHFGRFSAIVVDMCLDYFLAINFSKFSNIALDKFSESVYKMLNNHKHLYNEKALKTLNHMQTHNWLFSYKELSTIEKSLNGIAYRLKGVVNFRGSAQIIEDNKIILNLLFFDYFQQVINHSKNFVEP